MRIRILETDITQLNVDAIVNAANGRMIHGAGVAGAIRKEGGPLLTTQSQRFAPVPLGRVCITAGGSMPCKQVIHAAVMENPGGYTDVGIVANATRNSLLAAEAIGCETLALPAFGTGIGGLAPAAVAAVMRAEITVYARAMESCSVKEITLALFGGELTATFRGIFAPPPSSWSPVEWVVEHA